MSSIVLPRSCSSLISVIVPSYRAGPYLGQLIDSVLGQTHENWELLILDDGSGDLDHPDVAGRLGDPRIRRFGWRPNRGVSQATRMLMELATGEFWCYPGADDLLRPQFMAKRLAVLRKHLDVSVVFGRGGQIDENGQEIWFDSGRMAFERWDPRQDMVIEGEEMLYELLQGNPINTPSVMCRSVTTLQVLLRSRYDWKFSQDWFYWLLVAGNGGRFWYDVEVLHSYRFHPNQITRRDDMVAYRIIEPSLVLLTGLQQACRNADVALAFWTRLRAPLFALHELRAMRRGTHPEFAKWRALARQAWKEGGRGGLGAWIETLRFGWWFCRLGLELVRERRKGGTLYGLPEWVVLRCMGYALKIDGSLRGDGVEEFS